MNDGASFILCLFVAFVSFIIGVGGGLSSGEENLSERACPILLDSVSSADSLQIVRQVPSCSRFVLEEN